MPSVPEHILHKTPIRLSPQANVSKPQACQACQQRKRRCDRKRPSCSTCTRRRIPCVFEVKITDRSHPNFLTDLLKSVDEKDRRIATLEALLQPHLPGMTVETMSTDELAALSPTSPGPSTARAPSLPSLPSISLSSPSPPLPPLTPVPPRRRVTFVAGEGSEKMPDVLLASVEERLANLDFTAPTSKLTYVPTLKLTVVSFMHSQLGAQAENLESVTDFSKVAAWPPHDFAVKLVKTFVEHNATSPIYREEDALASLADIYDGDPNERATPLQTFTFFLIFALGLVWRFQGKKGEKIDTTLLRNRALGNLSAVLKSESGIACVSSLFLLSLWSVFDSGGPDVVPIFPIIVELALYFRLHHEPDPSLSMEEQDRRRILFWSIYCQERGIKGVLQVPLEIKDEDITVSLPKRLDPLGPLAEGADPVLWFRHMVAMRQIFWDVYIFASRGETNDKQRASLQLQLDEWQARNPRGDRAGKTGNYFDLYYHTIRASLYRPTTEVVPVWQLAILEVSASRSLQIATDLYKQRKWVDNPFHLSHAIAMGMSLLYSLLQNCRSDISKQSDPDWRNRATAMISMCQEVVSRICSGWPNIYHLSRAFNELSNRVLATVCGSYHDVGMAIPVQPAYLSPTSAKDTAFEDLHGHTPNAADMLWLNGAITNVENKEVELDSAALDALIEGLGWSQEWAQDAFDGVLG